MKQRRLRKQARRQARRTERREGRRGASSDTRARTAAMELAEQTRGAPIQGPDDAPAVPTRSMVPALVAAGIIGALALLGGA